MTASCCSCRLNLPAVSTVSCACRPMTGPLSLGGVYRQRQGGSLYIEWGVSTLYVCFRSPPLRAVNVLPRAAATSQSMLAAMNSLDENCTPDKRLYDSCFHSWFRNVFLKGKTTPDHDTACGELFAQYQTCLQVRKQLYFRVVLCLPGGAFLCLSICNDLLLFVCFLENTKRKEFGQSGALSEHSRNRS